MRLGIKNVSRWRVRLLFIAMLIGTTCSLIMLYGGYIQSSIQSGMASIEPLAIDNFDMLLLLTPEQRVIATADLPSPRYARRILKEQESTLLINGASSHGDLRLLGLDSTSSFFRLPEDGLQGRLLQNAGEIVMPQSWASARAISIGDEIRFGYYGAQELSYITLAVVGLYQSDDYPLALVSHESLTQLAGCEDNAVLINYLHEESTLGYLEEWMSDVYPGAVQISSQLPSVLGHSLLQRALKPGDITQVFIYLFMGIGVLTTAFMTFLERRGELATLKSIGTSNRQVSFAFGFEYSFAEILGVGLSWLVGLTLINQIGWFANLDTASIRGLLLKGNIFALLTLVISLIYPIFIAKIATVNQLLFARTIPLRILEFNYMHDKPTGALIACEIEENLRVLRIPYDAGIGRYNCMLFKGIGDSVKQGEIIASDERYSGHLIDNYAAICDGTIVDIVGPLV